MSAIFGGSKSKSQSQSTQSSQSQSMSSNQAYPLLSQEYTPQIGQGVAANSQAAALLGVPGTNSAAAASAFDNYRNSTDYDFTLNQGNQNITNNAAVNGSLGSGATLKALQGYGQNLAQKYLGTYISQLLGIGTAGQQAAQIVSGAGQQSSSTSSSQGQSTGDSSSSSTKGLLPALSAAGSNAAAGAG